MPPAGKYKFDEFEADVRSAELLRNGTRLKLQMQPFQVLLALLERPRAVVTREELRQRLWPEDTFVDFDHGLNTAVAKLRDALGDSAASPVFWRRRNWQLNRRLKRPPPPWNPARQPSNLYNRWYSRSPSPAMTTCPGPAAGLHERSSFWRR